MVEPNKWVVKQFADFGTSEQFNREFLELFDLLGATRIYEDQKKVITEAIGTILLDGLSPTFLRLREIRESVGQDLPTLNRLQMFEDFARKAWKSYKDLTQKAALTIGFYVGFLWQSEEKFETGLVKFRQENPDALPNFEDYFRKTRASWQNELATFRNEFLEHQTGCREDFKKFYDPMYVEELFYAVWRTIVNLLVILMNLKMPPGARIVEHSDALHGPGWPNRFRYEIDAFKFAPKQG